MNSIVIANEYQSVHTKNWCVPPKPKKLGRERRLKGPVKVHRNSGITQYDCPEDMLREMKKENAAAQPKYPDQESFENSEKQTGQGMWSDQLEKRILALNANLFVEDSILVPGCAAFYKMVDGQKKPTGASFKKGFIPEFTIFKPVKEFDSMGITYGWRTVLLRLLKTGDLTYAQMHRIFGEVKYGDERAKHWAMNVKEYRI